MSANQSRGGKNEPSHYRRSGRSGNSNPPRNISGGGGKGGGGGNTNTAPPSSASDKSFKKVVSNAQGAQGRGSGPNVNSVFSNSSTGAKAPQNGILNASSRGAAVKVADTAVKVADASVQKSNSVLPKAPQSKMVQPGSGPTGTTGPSTPVKGPGEASMAFSLQFGSISPGVINGLQVPARTNSAPPNMDVQKRDQAGLESLKASTTFQNPTTIPKQHMLKKDTGQVNKPNVKDACPTSEDKKQVPPSAPHVTVHSQKPTGPLIPSIPPISMQMPFHQSQIHRPFGGPNPQLQPQPRPNTTLPVPLPMHVPVGNLRQVTPQVFFQHHHQGIIHQTQGLPFGNMGMVMGPGPQYQQQQGHMGSLTFVSPRRALKITHPETREELQLDNPTEGYPNGAQSSPRPHPHGPSQSQGGPTFSPAHPMNTFYMPPPGSTQSVPGSQPPRFSNQQHASEQVMVKPAISSHAEKAVRMSPPVIAKTEISKSQKVGGEGDTFSKPHKETVSESSLSKTKNLTDGSVATAAAVEDSTTSVNSVAPKKTPVNRSGSFKEEPKQSSEKVQICGQSSSVSTSPVIDISVQGEVQISEISGTKEQIKELDQIQDCTISDVTAVQQKKPLNDIDDKTPKSVTTAVHGDQISDSSTLDVDQVSSQEPTSSWKVKGNNNNNTGKTKKKIKDILKKADARGTTSDLYNAYKRPEEKKETLSSDNTVVESSEKTVTSSDEKRGPAKFEPDDWEDAADISTSKTETGLKGRHSKDDNDGLTKKYSRDFLLKFLEHCTDLPEGFEITRDITEVFDVFSANVVRDQHPKPEKGGSGDRAVNPGSRLDRRPSNLGVDDKWNKGSVPVIQPGWDPRAEMQGYLGRGNHGMVRTPRGQPPTQYIGGVLSGQMQYPSPQGGGPMQRNSSDSDRWARGTAYQKGSMPSPHNAPAMHKAERKYEVGKVTDEEQAKQRQLKGILNKLTPQNFEKLFDQVKQVNIDNANTLSGVIGQIFDKALMEPTFVEMYANFCARLSMELPDFMSETKEKVTFRRLLLNKCQEEFERGVREEEEANRTEEEGEVKQTKEEREEKRVKARRRMLGNIRLIGELYKKKMLTERIMHGCIKKLLGQNQNPDEEDIEALCKLMSTIGEMIDHPKAKEHMDVYFDIMLKLSNNMDLSSRLRFMLKDAIDLRKNNWQQRRKVEGPKKIDEVHRDAANERQAQTSRLTRGSSFNTGSIRRGGQMEFGPQGSSIGLPSNPQMSGFRGPPQQFHGQDLRFDGFESRTVPTALRVPSRPMGDDNITFGPQGGLARGMSVRGQPSSMQGVIGGPNGFGSGPERVSYAPRENLAARYMSERRISPRPGYDVSNVQEHNMNYVNRDTRNSGPRVSTPPERSPSNNVLSEDRLRDLSKAAIMEFYSARDEKEVALCMKDLNAPSFYPTMISIWVNDSFERKDDDRKSLTKLLINLAKSEDGILSRDSLVKGLELVLSTLEDMVYDAPLAAEFLGQILAKILLENVISYKEVCRMIYEGGEQKVQLVESGYAAEVLGVILEIIKSEKGEPFLNDMRKGSDLRLENFRPPNKKTRLDKFI
ncbi:eukaryotic translation initiation factor 4G-like [Rutidosis leptorrhynchoides]|uniref:eukaryotic translation initiation factor 4G-like n=1 Tax=Rutidosis leptorrhynchoides TaxID=125765 RepID=UPI003A9A3CC1